MTIDQDAPPAGDAKDVVRLRSSREGLPEGAGRSGVTNPRLTRATIFLFAVASGLAVANAYFAHPLLDVMADDLKLSRTVAGLIVGATQLG